MKVFLVPTIVLSLAILSLSGIAAEELVKLDGESVQTTVEKITPDGQVICEGIPEPIDLQNLRTIRTEAESPPLPPTISRVYILGGGVVSAESVTIQTGETRIKGSGGNTWSFPMRHIRGIFMPAAADDAPSALSQFESMLESELRTDRALAIQDEQVRTVRCALLGLREESLTVNYKRQKRQIGRDKLLGVILARTADAPDRTGHCRVWLSDGSWFWARVLSMENGMLRAAPFPDHTISVPWKRIARMQIMSERMIFASDLDPVSVEQGAIVTFPWSYKRDQNVFGQPLSLGGRTYARGLGMHAPCEVTYSVGDNYTLFSAVIGIDDSTGGKGNCVFRVRADGEILFEKQVDGGDDPQNIRVDIADRNRISLQVDVGQNLDLGDAANWCEARFIK